MSKPDKGCEVCWSTRPAAVVTENDDGSRTLKETCTVCGEVWTEGWWSAWDIAMQAANPATAQLLRSFADALVEPDDSDPSRHHTVLDLAASLYGADAAEGLKAVWTAVAQSELKARRSGQVNS